SEHDAAALDRARAAAAALTFLEITDLDEALEQAATMAEDYAADGHTEAAWLAAALRQAPADAVSSTGAAVTVADSGTAWLAHARALAAAAQADANRRYGLNRQAALAAINAALRLPESTRAEALVVLSRVLEATYRGEAALAAMRVADRLAPGVAPEELVRLREAF